ncbi:hypothetical protein [Paenibacillus bovis]|uniref:Uncharacterized protein n=1 Tax=Paenibacillus bovis TaxID=1616788 RepID=A0A172ZKW5_9BACL|nr:hypothetical protein [Paenibacillus bovis]ANF98183.1 hypothetical protein AR543_20655 [Paenibacillus bovis]
MKSRITALLAILLFISIVINLQQYHTRIMNTPKQADTKNHYDQFTNRLYHTDQSMKDYQHS